MGNTSNVLQQRKDFVDPFDVASTNLFSTRIREVASIFETSSHFRATFVEYLQTGAWIESFMHQNSNFSHLDDRIAAKLSFLDAEDESEDSGMERPIALAEMLNCPERLHAILAAVALPIFLESTEFKQCFALVDTNFTEGSKSKSGLLSSILKFPSSTIKNPISYRPRGKSSDEDTPYDSSDDISVRKTGRDFDDAETVATRESDNCLSLKSSQSSFSSSPFSSTNSCANETSSSRRQIFIQSSLKEQSHSHFRAMVLRSLAVMDSLELDRMLSFACSDWLSELLLFVETLPVAVTVAAYTPDQQDTELFFCNRKFEHLTGFPRQEITPQNMHYMKRLYQPTNSSSQPTQSATFSMLFPDAATQTTVEQTLSLQQQNRQRQCVCDVTLRLQQKNDEQASLETYSKLKPISSTPYQTVTNHSLAHAKKHRAAYEHVLTIHTDIDRLKHLYLNSRHQDKQQNHQLLIDELYAINHLSNLLPSLFCL